MNNLPSKERLKEIANSKSDLTNKTFIYEDARRMAGALLACMEQEPIAYIRDSFRMDGALF